MRAQITLPAILVASLLGSTMAAVAQTGEFASPVPGQVVHEGWALQDELQNARSGMPGKSANPLRAKAHYDGDSNSAGRAAISGKAKSEQ